MTSATIRLLTKVEAISIAQLEGYPLSVRTFDRLVLTGLAPAAHQLIATEPVWTESSIREWSENQLIDVLTAEADRLLTASWRDNTPNDLPDLSTVRLADDLPTHVAVLQTERYLRAELSRLTLEREDCRRQLSTPVPLPARRSARLMRRIDDLDELENRIQADLRLCSSWIVQLLRWAQSELPRRRKLALEDADLEEERRRRCLDLSELELFPSSRAFATADPRRATPRDVERAPDRVTLDGLDLGYHWRLDTTDREAQGWSASGPGTWRVSWNMGNDELYAYDRSSDRVLLIGGLPSTHDLHRVIEWMRPIEARQAERNSLSPQPYRAINSRIRRYRESFNIVTDQALPIQVSVPNGPGRATARSRISSRMTTMPSTSGSVNNCSGQWALGQCG